MSKNKKTEVKEFENYDVQDGQVEAGIEYNPVTTDNTEQDLFNEDTLENMNEEDVVIENECKE